MATNPLLSGYNSAFDQQRMARTLATGSGIGSLAGLGRLQSGSQAQGLMNNVTFRRPDPYPIFTPKDLLSIREELQQDTDEWLKDV